MARRERVTNLTEGTIWKQLVLFALPLMASNLFQQLYNTADSLVVGRFVGSTALAAVGSTGSLTGLIIGFFMGMGTGSGVVISQYYGAKNYEKLQKSVHTAVALAIAFGIVLAVVGVVLSPYMLRWMSTPDDVMDQATLYLRIYFIGIISLTVYNIGAGILRAVGDSKRPLYYLIVSGVTNVVLNLIFVIVFDLGVAGVALATICSQVLSSVLVIYNLTHTSGPFKLHLKEIRFDKDILIQIAKIGLPAGVQSMVISLSNIVIQSKVNMFGSAAMAGHSAASRIDSFVYMPLNAISLATTTFTAQNLGAGKMDRVKKGTRTSIIIGLAATIAVGWIAGIAAKPLIEMFSDEQEVIFFGIKSLRMRCMTYFLFVFTDVLAGVIRGSGNAVVPMAISMINMCAVRILWLIVAMPFWKDFNVIVFSYPLTWGLASLCYMIYYLKGSWLKKWKQLHENPPEALE